MNINDKLFIITQVLFWGSVVEVNIVPIPTNWVIWGLMFGSGVTVFLLKETVIKKLLEDNRK